MLLSTVKLFFDFFLPRLCTYCNVRLNSSEKVICSLCYSNIEFPSQERIQNEFKRKFKFDKLVTDFDSAFVFHNESEIQSLIHSMKYDKNYHIGKFLGNKITEISDHKINSWNADLIIPIPLHPIRKAERGFNQANEIAKGISSIIKIPYEPNIIKRNRFTATQTKLTLDERKINVEGAFSIKKKKYLKNKNVILVDDVITTGATINECAKLLLRNGANKIYAFSVAIAD